MTRSFILLAAASLLAGCQSAPVIQERVTTVPTPVPTYPVKAADVPPAVQPLGPRPADTSAALDLALAKVCELAGYMLQADPLLQVASNQAPRPLSPWPMCEDPKK